MAIVETDLCFRKAQWLLTAEMRDRRGLTYFLLICIGSMSEFLYTHHDNYVVIGFNISLLLMGVSLQQANNLWERDVYLIFVYILGPQKKLWKMTDLIPKNILGWIITIKYEGCGSLFGSFCIFWACLWRRADILWGHHDLLIITVLLK